MVIDEFYQLINQSYHFTLFLLFICILIIYICYYTCSTKTELIMSDKSDSESVSKIRNLLTKLKYFPTFFLFSKFTQLIYHELYMQPSVNLKREYVTVKCGGTVCMDHAIFPYMTNKVKPKILIIMHGILGGSESAQSKDILRYFTNQENKFFDQIIFIVNKGINDTILRHPKPYTALSYDDSKEIFNRIIAKHNDCRIFIIGISLGSLLGTHLLINYPKVENIVAFVSISNPFNLAESYKNIGILFDKALTKIIKQRIINQQILMTKFSHKEIENISNLYDFEENFSKKIHKEITCVHNYWDKTSIDKRLKEIKYYSLFINSVDDNISPIKKLDYGQCNFLLLKFIKMNLFRC